MQKDSFSFGPDAVCVTKEDGRCFQIGWHDLGAAVAERDKAQAVTLHITPSGISIQVDELAPVRVAASLSPLIEEHGHELATGNTAHKDRVRWH